MRKSRETGKKGGSDELLDGLAQLVDAAGGRVEHGARQVDRQRLDADVV